MCAEGLAVPETTELVYGLRAAGWDVPLDALSIEECADAIAEFFKKDKLIKEFVKNELLISKRYRSNKQLFKCSNKYDAIMRRQQCQW